MRPDKYILDENRQPQPIDDLKAWGEWFEQYDRRIKRTVYNVNDNEIIISTVFLGLDHSFSDEGPPILFETMVFGGKLDQEEERYATWDQAIAGHDQMIRRVLSMEDQVSDWPDTTENGPSPD